MLDITEVILNEDKLVHYDHEITLKHLMYKIGNFKIVSASPAHLDVLHTSDGKIVINGNISMEVQIPCARCLERVVTGLDIQFDTETEIDNKDYIDGYNLDVDQLVHDEALLVWPERVLCKEDCKGLCSKCGNNLNDGSCNCDKTDVDPRMAKILDIFSNFKEV